ncbi:hypothetical protein [Acinetobacter sp. Marseille-Q1618]|nr:hypothetical protein [Acinetobacter sp. Marseille-Q1618]
MRNIFLVLITSMSMLLSACNDDNDDHSTTPQPPKPSTCKAHCAP